MFSVRGGAFSLEADSVAKFATAATGVNAAFFGLSPAKTIEAYGGRRDSPLLEWLVRATGGTLAMITLTATCLFFCGTGVRTAVGIGCLPWTINELYTILTGELDELGVPRSGICLSLAVSSLTALSLLTNAPHADIAMKAFAVWQVANGLFLSLAPGAAGKSWGVEGDDAVNSGLRTIGHFNTAAGVFNGALALGADSTTAFGYSFTPPLLLAISNSFTNQSEGIQFGASKGPQYVWALLAAVFVGTLAISGTKVSA